MCARLRPLLTTVSTRSSHNVCALAVFLATRGLWLILVEWVVMSTAITFSPFGLAPLGGRTLIVPQVLWAMGYAGHLWARVPFAFYIAHFYAAHALAVVIGVFQGFTVSQMMTLFVFDPNGFGSGCLGSTLHG